MAFYSFVEWATGKRGCDGRGYTGSWRITSHTCGRNSPALDDSTAVSEPRPLALALKNQLAGFYYLQSSQRMMCIWQSAGQTPHKRLSFVAAASRYAPPRIRASQQ